MGLEALQGWALCTATSLQVAQEGGGILARVRHGHGGHCDVHTLCSALMERNRCGRTAAQQPAAASRCAERTRADSTPKLYTKKRLPLSCGVWTTRPPASSLRA